MQNQGFEKEEPYFQSLRTFDVAQKRIAVEEEPSRLKGQPTWRARVLYKQPWAVEPALLRQSSKSSPLDFDPAQQCEEQPAAESISLDHELVYHRFRGRDRQSSTDVYFELSFLLSGEEPAVQVLHKENRQRRGLQFDSRFEGANLLAAYKSKAAQFILLLQSDINTRGFTGCFLFSVKGLEKGVPYTFKVINFCKPKSLFATGFSPLALSQQKLAEQGIGWERLPCQPKYYRCGVARSDGRPLFVLQFQLVPQYSQDKLYLSSGLVYSYSRLVELLAGLALSDRQFRVTQLARSVCGTAIPLVSLSARDKKRRKVIAFIARQHPGQSVSSFVAQGVLQFLVGGSSQSLALREKFNFKVVPMLNVDGVTHGNFRCCVTGLDLNRQWPQPNKHLLPGVHALKTLLLKSVEAEELQFVVDLHGHSKKLDSFAFCCKSSIYEHSRAVVPKQLPFLLSERNSCFKFEKCTWGLAPDKTSTARAVLSSAMRSFKVLTLESSMFGFERESKRFQISPKDLVALGRDLMASLCKLYCSQPLALLQINAQIEGFLKLLPKSGKDTSAESSVASDSNPDQDLLSEGEYQAKIGLSKQQFGILLGKDLAKLNNKTPVPAFRTRSVPQTQKNSMPSQPAVVADQSPKRVEFASESNYKTKQRLDERERITNSLKVRNFSQSRQADNAKVVHQAEGSVELQREETDKRITFSQQLVNSGDCFVIRVIGGSLPPRRTPPAPARKQEAGRGAGRPQNPTVGRSEKGMILAATIQSRLRRESNPDRAGSLRLFGRKR